MKLDFLKRFDFFSGVPDSQLKPLCDYLISEYGVGKACYNFTTPDCLFPLCGN